MGDFCATQKLTDYRIDTDNVVTAFFTILLQNNTDKTIFDLSIRESIGPGIVSIKAKVTSTNPYVIPISNYVFSLSPNGQLLNTQASQLLPCESAIVYLTLELVIENGTRVIDVCGLIEGK